MTAPAPGWQPLPECAGCGRPTRRGVHARLGGYCSRCRSTEHPAITGERRQLSEWQTTVSRIRRQEAANAAARVERLRRRREGRKDAQ